MTFSCPYFNELSEPRRELKLRDYIRGIPISAVISTVNDKMLVIFPPCSITIISSKNRLG